MKTLFLLALTYLAFTAHAATYYISNSSGKDSNTGKAKTTAWQTIAKLNANFQLLQPGDSILLKRGDTFYGSITIGRGGISGAPIILSAYGKGSNPVITGFTAIGAWTNIGGSIWESTNSIGTLTTCNMVVINGVNTPMGRFPGSGYLTYQSFVGVTSITSSSLTGSPNWTGADVVIRKKPWIIDVTPITAQSGGTLSYKTTSAYTGQNNWGFFIQNDARTLTYRNAWYYNPSTKKIRLFSAAMPTNVRVSTVEDLVTYSLKDYITWDNIDFTGANNAAFNIGSTKFNIIQNCNFSFCGVYAIWGRNLSSGLPTAAGSCVFQNNTFNHVNNNSIFINREYGNASINNNLIKNNGIIPGASLSGDGNCYSIRTEANGDTIRNNKIDTSGYIGIGFDGVGVIVKNNFVNWFCTVKDDGAGIYSSNNPPGKQILNNIIINGIGNFEGTTFTYSQANGIYLDNGVTQPTGVVVTGNSVGNIGQMGYLLHNVLNTTLTNNTAYNCGAGISSAAICVINDLSGSAVTGLIMKNNICVSRTATQRAARFQTLHNDFKTFGIIDSNYYARPIDDNLSIDALPNSSTEKSMNLTGWQAFSGGEDTHSHISLKMISNIDDLRFEYNAGTSIKTISLPFKYVDLKNVLYQGRINIAPFTSLVLVRK